jgi:hypothetical protein
LIGGLASRWLGSVSARFGSSEFAFAIANEASGIWFLSPPSTPGVKRVSVSIDHGRTFVYRNMIFEYRPALAINSVIPTSAIVSGRSAVTIWGLEFTADSLFCRFDGGNVFTAHVLSSSQAICTTPQSRPGIAPFELSHNAFDWERMTFLFESEIILQMIAPQTVSCGGDASITVIGSGFFQSLSLSCQFGSEVIVNARFISGTRIRALSATKVAFGSGSFLLVDFRHDFIVQPTALVAGMSTTFTVFSGSFSFAQTIASAFCNINSISDFWPLSIQGKSATCQVNISRPGSYFLRTYGLSYVNCAGSLQASGALGKIEVIPSLIIASITPPFASFDGNTLVTVRGEKCLTSGLSLQCIFGSDFSQGFVMSSGVLSCFSPQVNTSKNGFGLQFGEINVLTNLTFPFAAPILLLRVNPTFAHLHGGTTVVIVTRSNIVSYNFFKGIDCVFDGLFAVEATIQSDFSLVCQTPYFAYVRTSTLSLRDRLSGFIDDAICFDFKSGFSLIKLEPSIGSVVGGYPIRLLTSANNLSSGCNCAFGSQNLLVPCISSLGSKVITCVAPRKINSTKIDVRVIDGLFGAALDDLSFEYVDPPEVDSLTPSMVSAGSISIVILKGRSFSNRIGIWCRLDGLVDSALVRSDTLCTCMIGSSTSGNITLEISTDGVQYFRTNLQLVIQPMSGIVSITPSLGSLQRELRVTVYIASKH